MEDYSETHTFVICAYKESEYLEEAILSLKNQTVKSKILIATSTDNKYIRNLAKKYNIEVIVNSAKNTNIGKDFNFALSTGKTKLVTVAHQDDKYDPEYVKSVVEAYLSVPKSLIIFTDYKEIKDGKIVEKSKMLRIKRLLLIPLKINNKAKFFKRWALAFGNPILCPSVTFNMDKIKMPIFDEHYKSDVDWYAWEKLSKEKGNFLYIPKKLSYHRIHDGQETVKTINDNVRIKEDYDMFSKFWPKPIAKGISHFYKKSERLYK